jgi:hypothetical protein
MTKKPISEIKTIEEAREIAIVWQNWFSEHSLAYSELNEWQQYFLTLAEKFGLVEEFKENGII